MTKTIETHDIAEPGSLDVGRRTLLKMTATGITAAGVGAIATSPAIAQPAVTLTDKWDKVFPKSDKVAHRKITFKNRYGITDELPLAWAAFIHALSTNQPQGAKNDG